MVNIDEEIFQEVTIFDKPALFTNARIDKTTVPNGWGCYNLRGSDYDPGYPITIENDVLVNHAGSILIKGSIELNNGVVELEDNLNFTGSDITFEAFANKYKDEN